jgi:hypothetical protein
MPTILDCPNCRRKLRVTESASGDKFQCPSCGTTFAPAPNVNDLPDVLPVTTTRCPYCREDVEEGAHHCRYCGEDLSSGRAQWEVPGAVRRDAEPHRSSTVLPLGIIGLVCGLMPPPVSLLGLVLSVCAWLMGHRDVRLMREGVMDGRGREATTAGMICGQIGTVFGGLWLLAFGGAMLALLSAF